MKIHKASSHFRYPHHHGRQHYRADSQRDEGWLEKCGVG